MSGLSPVGLIGCGTIGTAIAAALASSGRVVHLHDINPSRLQGLADGTARFDEPALAEAVADGFRAGRLCVGRGGGAVGDVVVCVPTPLREDGELDEAPLRDAVSVAGAWLCDGGGLHLRSTVPIGTSRRIAAEIVARGRRVAVAATPDRSIEGRSFADQAIVPHLIGGVDRDAMARAMALLAPVGRVIDAGSAEQAEAAKMFANAHRAARFALANLLASICETRGLDAERILEVARDGYPRFDAPRPGPVGGPCLDKDIRLLAAGAGPVDAVPLLALAGTSSRLLEQAAATMCAHLAGRGATPRVALLGMAFKGTPPVADLRGSAATALLAVLRARVPLARFIGWDHELPAAALSRLGLEPAPTPEAAVSRADLVVVCNDHPILRQADLAGWSRRCAEAALIYDLCHVTAAPAGALANAVRRRAYGQGDRP